MSGAVRQALSHRTEMGSAASVMWSTGDTRTTGGDAQGGGEKVNTTLTSFLLGCRRKLERQGEAIPAVSVFGILWID